jgi:hypothetical protein
MEPANLTAVAYKLAARILGRRVETNNLVRTYKGQAHGRRCRSRRRIFLWKAAHWRLAHEQAALLDLKIDTDQRARIVTRVFGQLRVGETLVNWSRVYRADKFFKRNRVSVFAVILLFIAIVAAIIATVWQSRVAQVERARAGKRFNDVRKLANSYIFDVYPEIENLEGSLKAREKILFLLGVKAD